MTSVRRQKKESSPFNKSLWVMCDFDSKKEKPEALRRRFRWLAELMWGKEIKWRTFVKPSPSKRGWHFWAYPITSPETARIYWSQTNILLLQCLMGSDIKRERMNFKRIRQGISDWNVLFSTRREKL